MEHEAVLILTTPGSITAGQSEGTYWTDHDTFYAQIPTLERLHIPTWVGGGTTNRTRLHRTLYRKAGATTQSHQTELPSSRRLNTCPQLAYSVTYRSVRMT